MNIGLTQAGGGWQSGQWAGMYVGGDLGPNANSQFSNPAGNVMPSDGTTVTACSQGGASCTWGGPSGNGAYFEIVADAGTGAYQHADFLGGYLYLSDNESPAVTAISGMPAESWRNASAISPYVAVQDGGLGVGSSPYGAAVEIGVDGTYSSANTAGPACDGGPSSYCPDTFAAVVNVPNLRGERNVSIRSRDIIGRVSGTTNYTVRNDDQPPIVALSGRFGAFALDSTVQTGAARTMVKDTPFVVTVTDGSTNAAGNRRSGVENLTTQFFRADASGNINLADPVAGTSRTASNNSVPSCDAANDPSKNSCPLKLAGTFSASSLAAGTYFLRVVAKDYAGLTTAKTFKVAVGIAEIASVTEGQASSRYVPLQIQQNRLETGGPIPAGSSGAGRLMWRSFRNGTWIDVDTSCVQRESSGAKLSALGGWPVALNAVQINGQSFRTSERWVVDLDCLRLPLPPGSSPWDVQSRLPDGEVFFAARIEGSTPIAQRGSEDVTVRYDHGGKDTNDDTANLGPGSVDLVTGNLAVSSTDVSIDAFKSPLTVSRTYNSRYGADDYLSIFGPGWRAGQPAESSGSDYVALTDNADVGLPEEERYPFVEVTDSQNSIMSFELDEATGKYISEVGLESLELAREGDPGIPTKTVRFTLTDRDSGTVTTFERPDSSAATGTFVPVSIAELGTPDSTKLTYTFADGRSYLSTAVAASGTVTCSDTWSNLGTGCQALKYNYISIALPAPFHVTVKRLSSVTLRTYAPELSTGNGVICDLTNMCKIPVASYAYDVWGRLIEAWDPRISPALKTTYTYTYSGTPGFPPTDNSLASVRPPGEEAFNISYRPLPEDNRSGRVDKVSRPNLAGGAATWSLRYYVPTHGAAAPFDFSQARTSEWGQENGPFMATAVFPPDQQPAGYPATASEYSKASISYLDPLGREVNAREPGDRVNVTEYSKYGEVTRSLSAENRARAMAQPTASARLEFAQRWDTQNTYTDVPGSLDARRHLVRTVGPERLVQMEDRSRKQARAITQTCYDERSPLTSGDCKDKAGPDGVSGHEGSAITTDPTTEPLDLPTTTRSSALVNSGIDQAGRATVGTISDTRTTTMTYGATEKEWKLRIPRETVTDPGTGKLNIKRRATLNSDGLETERFQPRSQASNEPSTTKTIYYTAGANPDHSSCGNKPEWIGLPCKVSPGAQPSTSGLAKLPLRTIEYNYLRQPQTLWETVTNADGGTNNRRSLKTYDLAGRVVRESVAGSTAGVAVKTTEHVFSPTTGREEITRSINSDGTVYKSVARTFDSLGRMTNYQDAAGHGSVTSYDGLSRVKSTNDGKATRTYGYDAVTGDLTTVADSGAGTFLAEHDADGRLVTTALPGGITKAYDYDAAGASTRLRYTKTTGCSSNCTLFANTAAENAHGQMVNIRGDLAEAGQDTIQSYSYDAAGRLTRATDWVDDGGIKCTTRSYGFDADSNRLTKRTAPPLASGSCDTSGGVTQTNTYDAADRLTNPGYNYDAFGRITTVPQADAGGSSDLRATYYVNDLARSISQDATTQTINLDPLHRVSTKVKSGAQTGTDIYAYTDDSDSPAWIATGANWTRYAEGASGDIEVRSANTGTPRILISNLRGDIVAESDLTGNLSNITRIDEFGVPATNLPSGARYGFHGTKQREALTTGGTIAMGVRLYGPRIGRFMQVDPVPGGTANPYEYPSDPINSQDLDGRCRVKAHMPTLRITGKGSYELWGQTSWNRCAGREIGRVSKLL
ncbi:MAG: RHS repeat-associated core domain-containing protein [Solirubrobacterales bacterium]